MVVLIFTVFLTLLQITVLVSQMQKLKKECTEDLKRVDEMCDKKQDKELREKLHTITEKDIRKRRIYSVFSACCIFFTAWLYAIMNICTGHGMIMFIAWFIVITAVLIFGYYRDIKAMFMIDSGSEEQTR